MATLPTTLSGELLNVLANRDEDGELDWAVAERAFSFHWSGHLRFESGKLQFTASPEIREHGVEWSNSDERWLNFEANLVDALSYLDDDDRSEAIANLRALIDDVERNPRFGLSSLKTI